MTFFFFFFKSKHAFVVKETCPFLHFPDLLVTLLLLLCPFFCPCTVPTSWSPDCELFPADALLELSALSDSLISPSQVFLMRLRSADSLFTCLFLLIIIIV